MRRLLSTSAAPFDAKAFPARAAYAAANARARGVAADVPRISALAAEWAAAAGAVDAARAARNAAAARGAAGGAEAARAAGAAARAAGAAAEARAAAARAALDAAGGALPNDTHPAAPLGPEAAAVELGRVGPPPRAFSDGWAPRDHVELGARLGLFDWPGAAAAAGAGFASLARDGVRLELALVAWALARAEAAGFSTRAPPDVARAALVEACGFAPRGGAGAAPQIYALPADGLALVGTAEVPLAALREGALLPADAAAAPALFAAWGHCFRREAGGAGAATRGLYRLHQFTKVELFAFVAPTAAPPRALADPAAHAFPALAAALAAPPSAARAAALPPGGAAPAPAAEAVFSRLVDFQASLVAELGLSARVLDMPSEELGAPAFRKVDVEVWMPARAGAAGTAGAWGEVSSASNCGDYQARRLGARYRASARAGDVRFLHTLNATAAAVPRLLLALLETHQTRDGDVPLPRCLWPYMGGQTVLVPPAAPPPPFGVAGAWGVGAREGEGGR